MELKFKLIVICFSIIAISFIINMIRKEKLDLKYSLSWILLILSVVILSIIPNLIEGIAKFIGVATPINAIFFLGFIFSLIIIFTLTVAQSRSSKKVTRLSQEIALLNNKINGNSGN